MRHIRPQIKMPIRNPTGTLLIVQELQPQTYKIGAQVELSNSICTVNKLGEVPDKKSCLRFKQDFKL